jgi:hypothetical protein
VADFDLFANQLLEEAKRFVEKAKESSDVIAKAANLHAALMLSFCALEAHLNSIADEFSIQKDLSVHEKGMLLERGVRLEEGIFQLHSGLKMQRLEDRIQFLHAKFSGKPVDRSSDWWGQLAEAIALRNRLTHAKTVPNITEDAVRNAIKAIIFALDALYQAIYRRKFPPASKGLQSLYTF